INCGIFGLSFFSIRELCLAHQQKNKLRNYYTRNIDELISSIITGGLTGGLFSAIIHGRQGLLSSIFLFSFISGLGHVCYTSAYNYRHQLILKSKNIQPYSPPMSNSMTKEISNNDKKEYNDKKESKDKKMTEGFLNWLAAKKWTGIKKLSEEEYNQIKQARAEAKEMQLGNLPKINESSDNRS
ncbi:18531_t:CDS:2, partial [Racocetra persica]